MYSKLKVRKVDQIPEYLLSCKFQKNIYIYHGSFCASFSVIYKCVGFNVSKRPLFIVKHLKVLFYVLYVDTFMVIRWI